MRRPARNGGVTLGSACGACGCFLAAIAAVLAFVALVQSHQAKSAVGASPPTSALTLAPAPTMASASASALAAVRARTVATDARVAALEGAVAAGGGDAAVAPALATLGAMETKMSYLHSAVRALRDRVVSIASGGSDDDDDSSSSDDTDSDSDDDDDDDTTSNPSPPPPCEQEGTRFVETFASEHGYSLDVQAYAGAATFIGITSGGANSLNPLVLGVPPATTVRTIVRSSVGGAHVKVRLRFENARVPFIGQGIVVSAARFARASVDGATGGATGAIDAVGVPLLFGGSPSVMLTPGAVLESDSFAFTIAERSAYAVSMYFADGTGALSFQWDAATPTYAALGAGDQTSTLPPTEFTTVLHERVLVDAVLVEAPRMSPSCYLPMDECRATLPGSLAIIGNSLSSGVGSTFNRFRTVGDYLSARLASTGVAVATRAISGRALRTNADVQWLQILSTLDSGFAAIFENISSVNVFGSSVRTDIVALIASSPTHVLVQIGTNDLQFNYASHVDIINALDLLLFGIRTALPATRIYLATIIPVPGAACHVGVDTCQGLDAARQTINAWIRNAPTSIVDATVDYDACVRDPDNVNFIRAEYAAPDGIHLNDAGYRAEAECIDIAALFNVCPAPSAPVPTAMTSAVVPLTMENLHGA